MAKKGEQNIETLKQAIDELRDKILEHADEFKTASLTQEVTLGSGETVIRSNPIIGEYRGLVKDYYQALKAYTELTGKQKSDEPAQLADIRARFKIAK
jgi:hypothetical protein